MLSASTLTHCQNNKLQEYKPIPSLQHILFLESESIGAQLHTRGADGSWPAIPCNYLSLGDEWPLSGLETSLPLSGIHTKIPLQRRAFYDGLVNPRRLFLATIALSACNRSSLKRIGVIPKATSHLFFVAIHAGVNQAAAEEHVEVLWNGPSDETDHTRQIQIVDSMIAQRVDAIAISATDERALAAPLKRAIAAGIPIAMFDSAADIEDYVTFIATDNHGAGCTAARTLAALVGNQGKVAMIMQKPGGTSTGLRETGFAETIAKEFPKVEIAARQFGMADPARSRAAAENILTAQPDLAGIFASSEAASIGAIQAIRVRGLSRKVRLVTFDSSETHLAGLEDGIIDAMLLQDPRRIGYEAVRALAQKLAGKTPARRLDLPARLITKVDLGKPGVAELLRPPI